ncbi:MAG: GNAT family N-acetyltransferase [Erysipelotrichaceae bacterium]|nr:GNAT family N-acetyltransferase [Erysipelotrichaceae bacterium]
MIQQLQTIDGYSGFLSTVMNDPDFRSPHYKSAEEAEEGICRSLKKKNEQVLGVFDGAELTGIFIALLLDEEHYCEMLECYSENREAYRELFVYLQKRCPGYQIDFVFNPGNRLLQEELRKRGAEFEQEQQKMLLPDCPETEAYPDVRLLQKEDVPGYLAIHDRDLYWTGEKVLATPERFRSFVALADGKVVGYIDVTCCFDENEPYCLFVKEEYRNRGYGRKLLETAVSANRPKAMMLLVDTDNLPALKLYQSIGFQKVEGQNSLTAHLRLKEGIGYE